MIITEEQVHELILKAVEAAGSQKNFANECGISEQYMSDIVNKNRVPAASVLKRLGIEKKTVYEID